MTKAEDLVSGTIYCISRHTVKAKTAKILAVMNSRKLFVTEERRILKLSVWIVCVCDGHIHGNFFIAWFIIVQFWMLHSTKEGPKMYSN